MMYPRYPGQGLILVQKVKGQGYTHLARKCVHSSGNKFSRIPPDPRSGTSVWGPALVLVDPLP